MRSLGLVVVGLVGLALGCGSVLTSPDGGAGGSSGMTGGGGTTATGGMGGTTGTAGAGGGCVWNGVTYPPGASFPSDCNTCHCAENGQIGCTLIACPPVDAGSCTFDTTYRYGNTGGLVAYEDTATLKPPVSYTYERSSRITDPASSSCSPALPACGVEDLYNPADIMRAIGDPAVQAALAMPTPPIYGRDTRPVDGSIFQFLRADGRGFLAGTACGSGGGTLPTCNEVPAGVARLVNLLRALDEQQRRDPSCAALR